MATSVIKDENKIVQAAVPLTSSTEYINDYSSYMSGHLVAISFNALSIPTSTWTEIATLSKPPIKEAGVIITDSSISKYGKARVAADGKLRIYHANGSTISFYGIQIMYLTNA